jgi:hypothetical protein
LSYSSRRSKIGAIAEASGSHISAFMPDQELQPHLSFKPLITNTVARSEYGKKIYGVISKTNAQILRP